MKVVYNNDFGGFAWPGEIYQKFGIHWNRHDRKNRTNPDIIAALEAYLSTNPDSDLRVIDIPDEATDWMIVDYDGLETVYCVIDGKLYYIDEDDELGKAGGAIE